MPDTQDKYRRCNRWKWRDWEISCQPALPPSLKLPGGDLTKPRAGTAGLPLNISFLLKPNFRHSCIPLFKRKNVEAAVILPIHLRSPIQILVECNRLRCNSMWVLSARAARECINGKWMPQSAFDELLVSFFNPLLATNWCCTWTTELVNRCNRTDNQIRQIGRWMVGCECRKHFHQHGNLTRRKWKSMLWSNYCVSSTDLQILEYRWYGSDPKSVLGVQTAKILLRSP